MADIKNTSAAGLDPLQKFLAKMEKKREADQADVQAVVSRAQDIVSGSPLRFNRQMMEETLRAFIKATNV